MARVVYFELHSSDPEAAAGFYRAVFGWKIDKWDGPVEYWLVATGEGRGIDGGGEIVVEKQDLDGNIVGVLQPA